MKPIPKAMGRPVTAVRILSLMLLLSLAFTARAFTVDGLNYSVYNGVAVLTGATSRNITSLTIPATVTYGSTTYPVNEIHRDAFDNYTSLRKVHIESSDQPITCNQTEHLGVDILHTPDTPFDNCPIDEFIIERDQFVYIGYNSIRDDILFLSSTSYDVSLTYGGKVKTISSGFTFKYFLSPTQITSLTIGGDSLVNFGTAFNSCTNLKKINLLPGPYTIASDAFPSGLVVDSLYLGKVFYTHPLGIHAAHVTFGDSWTSIPYRLFHDEDNLKTVTFPQGIREIGKEAFNKCSNLTNVKFPDSLKKIVENAFKDCTKLQDISFNQGLEIIEGGAFQSCYSLTQLSLPASITKIGDFAFYDNANIKSITFEGNEKLGYLEIPNSCFGWGGTVDSLVINRVISNIGGCYPENIVFGDCWKIIPNDFLRHKSSVKTVALPNGLTEIYGGAFHNCSNLTTINFPDSLKKIWEEAFKDCKQLKEVVLPEGLQSLGYSSFNGCTSMTRLSLPVSVKTIGRYAFYGCGQLRDVRTAAIVPPVCDGSGVFDSGTYNEGTLTVPVGKKKVYRGAEVWKLFKNVQSEGGGFKVAVSYDSQYGQVTLNGSDTTEVTVDEDEPLTIAITPNEGYRLTRFTINGEDMTASLNDNLLAFESIDSNMAIEVEFSIITYTITLPETSAGGHIEVNGLDVAPATVDYGSRLELTAIADRGHKLDAMTVNGKDVTAALDQNHTYMIERVTENVTVSATFSPITYTITAVNANTQYGDITLNGQTGSCIVAFGQPLTVGVNPHEGCYLVSLTIDGIDVTAGVADSKYTVESVEADMTVEAVFAINTYTVDLKFDPAKGDILFDRTGSGTSVTVDYGDELRLTVVPAEGYETATVTLDGKDVTGQLDENGVLTLTDITSDHTVEATFDVKRVRLSVLGIEGGRIAMHYDYGTEATLFIEPEEEWDFHSLTVGEMTVTELEADGSYTTSPLTDDTDVSVVFKRKATDGIAASSHNTITVSARQRTVTINGAEEGAPVEIFDTAGLAVYSGTDHVITLDRQGVHIVRVSGLTFKVMLR